MCPATRTSTSKCAPLPLARAPATEPRPQVPAVRAAPSPPVLRAVPRVAPVPRSAPPPSTVQAPQPLDPDAHSTEAPQVPYLINLRVAAPPSRVRVDTPPFLSALAVLPLVQQPARDQQHLVALRKKACIAASIGYKIAQSQCSAIVYGKHCATVSETRERRKPAQSQQRADVAPASIAWSSSSATTHHCTATRSGRAKPKSKRILGFCTQPHRKRYRALHSRCSPHCKRIRALNSRRLPHRKRICA